VLLLQLRYAEDALTGAEASLEVAADVLHGLEEQLAARLTLQGYNPPRDLPRNLPRWATFLAQPWIWTVWQLRRMRSQLSMGTQPPSPCITSACLSRSDAKGAAAPIENCRTRCASTTAASAEPLTPSEPSTAQADQG
jgi:hypothetical protein